MKVMHLISSTGYYGAERVLMEIAKGLRRHHCHPVIGVIASHPKKCADMIREAGRQDIETKVFLCDRKFSAGLALELKRFMDRRSFDIVHSHGYKSNFYAFMAAGKRIPLIATNHNWLRYRWRLVAYSMVDKVLIRFFRKIIAVSQPVYDEMLGAGIPKEKMDIIFNGVDIDEIDREVREALEGDPGSGGKRQRIVGTICALKKEKGLRFFLEAALATLKNHDDVRFVIVGEGPLRGELENFVASHRAKGDIVFTGYRSDVFRMLAAFEVFVLPSVAEGLPMVLLEAMAAKVPVVATHVGSIPSVISSSENGILVAPGDSVELEKSIGMLLEDPVRAQAMALNGYATVKARFTSQVMFSRYYEKYLELRVH